MAKKASGPVDPLKAKEAKQKKIAAVGGVILLIVLAIQVPKLMKQLGHSSAPPPPPPATTVAAPAPAPATTTGSDTGFTPGSSGASATGGASIAPSGSATASVGQLTSFGSFVSKDPFASQTPQPGTVTAKPGSKTTTTSTPKPPTPPTPPVSAPTPTSAVISVNGVKEQVDVGSDFPSSQPFFELVSLTQHSAKVAIAGGSLASGNASLTIKEGKPVTLMNTTDGTRYKIELFPQGTTITAPTTTTAAPPTVSTTSSGTTTGGTTTATTTVVTTTVSTTTGP